MYSVRCQQCSAVLSSAQQCSAVLSSGQQCSGVVSLHMSRRGSFAIFNCQNLITLIKFNCMQLNKRNDNRLLQLNSCNAATLQIGRSLFDD